MSSAGSYGAGGGGGVGNVKFLTGNSGGPVGPDLVGNINILGGVDITVSGNAGDNTLTINLTGSIANTYETDSGTATPALGILHINGLGGITTSGSGNTIEIDTDGSIATNYNTDSGTAIPSADDINFFGTNGITTSGTGDTVTITSDGTLATTYDCDNSTSATPSGGILNVTGGSSGAVFTGSGNTITESFDYLNIPQTNTPGTVGVVKMAGSNIIAFYGGAGNFNMSMGFAAGNPATTGSNNIGYGHASLNQVTSGFANVAFGPLTLEFLTTGNTNVAMGLDAMQNATTASGNLAVGYQPMQNLLTGGTNIALGYTAGSAYVGAESNNILIQNAGVAAESNQIRIGTQGSGTGQQNACNIAGIYGSTVGGTNALVFIDNTGQLGTTGGTFSAVTSIDGSTIGSVPISGALTITGGTSGAVFATAGTTITESFDFLDMADSSSTTGYIQIGSTRVFNCGAGVSGHNTFVGQNAGNSTLSGTQNVCIGDGPGASGAGAVLTTGNLNTSCGYGTFNNLGSGFQNAAFGGNALENVTTGHNNTGCGQGTLASINTGSNNTGLGYAAGSSYTTGSEANNLCVGANVTGVNGESNTIRIGDTASATACYVAGTYGQTVGGTNAALFIDNTGKLGTVGGAGGGVTSITGDLAGSVAISGALTLTGGTSGATFGTTGTTITESFNFLAMSDTTATTGYISLGGTIVLQAGGGVANNNIFVGEAAGNTTLSGTSNVGVGAGVLTALTSATNNVGVGRLSLAAATSGGSNVAAGFETLQHLTTSTQNTAVGYQALQQMTTGTGQNVAIGAQTMSFLGTGSNNIAIGYQSGFNLSGTEANNILISNQGVNAESGAIRIGTNTTHTTCFVQGIAGVTVANTAAVLVNTANGQLGTVISSRRFKENIQDMGSTSSDLYKLRPVKFNFKGDYNQSYGLIAEDVEEVAPYLVSYDKEGLPSTVKYHELPALLLNEIQRLKLKIEELEGKFNSRVR